MLPKSDVIHIHEDATIRQVLEKMEFHRYTAVPIVNEEGEYVGTVTEGDLLWHLKNTSGLSLDTAHHYSLKDVPLRMNNKPVRIDADMEHLILLSKSQNFVPVTDDRNRFIGIVRRSDIIDYCAQFIRTGLT
nr:CBS domain-containing protein [Paenibacillus turpanensis]